MRRVLLAAPWVALAYGALLSESHGSTPVAECVEVTPAAEATGMSMRVRNTCEVAVRCELTWRVRCEGDTATSPVRDGHASVRLAASAEQQLLASGAACGDEVWEITDDVWDCKQVR
jgi:hypothetical protein